MIGQPTTKTEIPDVFMQVLDLKQHVVFIGYCRLLVCGCKQCRDHSEEVAVFYGLPKLDAVSDRLALLAIIATEVDDLIEEESHLNVGADYMDHAQNCAEGYPY